jgi:diguanylate cyclase (GGDEF)-like protein
MRSLAAASALTIILLLAFGLSNYRLLVRKKKVERDRQEILEMVALREPLESILRRIVLAIAENQPGAIGAALQYSGGVLQYLAFSAPLGQMRHTEGRWTIGNEGVLRTLAFLGLEHGSTIPIRSGKQAILGAMVAIFPAHGRKVDQDVTLMEGLGGIARVAIEDARLHDQLTHQAQHDVLTGLPDRLLVETRLQSALQEAAEGGQSVALFFLDIDRFKHVNDSLGHHVGDSFLAQVAARLIQSIPDGAVAGRIGGDEFTVILRCKTEKADVERAALRILDALGAPLTVGGSKLHPSASLGISMFPQDGGDAATLQRRADLALYRAKSRGKNRHEFFSHDIGDSAVEAMAMEQALRKALDDNWLELYYQAQFTQLGELAGMEALVRLHHPIFGLVGPSIFITLAEETGLIHRLGEWVLTEACR